MKRFLIMLLVLLVSGLLAHTCLAANLKMATTTSVENTGLLDLLLPAFEKECGIKIYALAMGTGKALKLAENGDVDLVLVHAPYLESRFMMKGFGLDRKTVFYNDFVIIGPVRDPAGIRNLKEARGAFEKISAQGTTFISRGDSSGTNMKELEIWGEASLSPKGRWYAETGQGMGPTLIIAGEKEGYCLVDRGTYLSYKDKIDLVILHEGDPSLKNPYSVITVSPVRYPHVEYEGARLFMDWVGSREARNIISGLKKNGEALFHVFD
ncbi:substrate-binding domain-containing protein [Omnitrophica bacterium]|nr:substrate-binding domain-containing protein [Candidatus Omnitrophota bacterium]